MFQYTVHSLPHIKWNFKIQVVYAQTLFDHCPKYSTNHEPVPVFETQKIEHHNSVHETHLHADQRVHSILFIPIYK